MINELIKELRKYQEEMLVPSDNETKQFPLHCDNYTEEECFWYHSCLHCVTDKMIEIAEKYKTERG